MDTSQDRNSDYSSKSDDEDSMSSVDDGQEPSYDFKIKSLIPRPYQSASAYQTEEEVRSQSLINSRPLIKLRISRRRRDYGQLTSKFSTAENAQPNEIRQTRDPNFKRENYKKVLEIGLQAGCDIKLLPQPKGMGFQSTYFRATNMSTQFSETDYINASKESMDKPSDVTETSSLETFIRNVEQVIEEALQSNETIDVFHDEFEVLGKEEGEGGNLANIVNELRTFNNLDFTNRRYVNSVEWQPGKDDIIAACCIENIDFQERVVRSGKNISGSIVIWSFAEFSNTLLVLKAPLEIMCFKFNPSQPNIIVGGMITGQVLMWDTNLVKEKNKLELLPKQNEAPELLPLVSSGIYDSHKGPVMSLSWLPRRVRIERKNLCTVLPEPQQQSQIATLSEDGLVLFWETTFPADKNPYKNPDFLWQPLIKVQLIRPESRHDLGGSRLYISPEQSDSSFWASSDSGDLLKVDWFPRSVDESRPEHVKKMYTSDVAFRPCLDCRISPFFSDIILTVHDFHFCIWKDSCDFPIFTSYFSGAAFTCGDFSPSRPGVVFIGRADGRLDIWDFLDQSHKESLFHSVTSNKLTCISFLYTRKSPQWVAVGDSMGSVHILEIARQNTKDTEREKKTMYEFWCKEEKRVGYFEERFTTRAEEAQKAEMLKYQMESRN
jgi:WD40 repeat protein